MVVRLHKTRGRRRRPSVRLYVEPLEPRRLLTGPAWPGLLQPVAGVEPNDTLDRAQDLAADLNGAGRAEVVGFVGDGPAGAADVDWYRFTLTAPAAVNLATLARQGGSPLTSVLSLYGADPGDPQQPALGFRLLAQDDGAARQGDAELTRPLGAGTYYVAVSGSANLYFHPLLADSGYAGGTGAYGLLLTATPLQPVPAVLASDPAPGVVLPRSPLVLRLDLGAPPGPGQSARLETAAGQLVASSAQFLAASNQLQVTPDRPLGPGSYRLLLLGPSGGELFVSTFQVTGVEDGAAADDTPATAHALGDLGGAGLVQARGAVGDDPFYDLTYRFFLQGPGATNPGADVDLYRFEVSGPGRYVFLAEAFAGRIGSPLDPALALFRLDAGTGQLVLVATNDNTLNTVLATDGRQPLFKDAALNAGLTAGTYFLAVSAHGNAPDLAFDLQPGLDGVYDPLVSHSGRGGSTTGAYVLNLRLELEPAAPQVLEVTPGDGAVLDRPPTRLTVRFDQWVNVQPLALASFLQTLQNTVPAVFIQGADGRRYVPRLESFDPAAFRATFLMPDGLPNGAYELHLSGPLGLAGLGGTPLAGNDPGGDFVVRFTVDGPPRGTDGDPRQWQAAVSNGDLDTAQDLGVLFPHELLAPGVTVTRDFAGDPAGAHAADFYRLQVLEAGPYLFSLTGAALPPGVAVTLFDAAGNPVAPAPGSAPDALVAVLVPGTYTVRVGGWPLEQAAGVVYQLHVVYATPESPTPLSLGPAPALRMRLAAGGDAATRRRGDEAANATLVAASPRPPASAPQPAGDLPADVLRALASGPVGGVGGVARADVAGPPDRVFVSGPELAALQVLTQLTILTQSGRQDENFAGPPAGSPAAGNGAAFLTESAGALVRSWARLLDGLFAMGQWLEQLPARAEAVGTPRGSAEDGPGADGVAAPEAPADRADEPPADGWAWVAALGLLAGHAAAGRRQRKRAGEERQEGSGKASS